MTKKKASAPPEKILDITDPQMIRHEPQAVEPDGNLYVNTRWRHKRKPAFTVLVIKQSGLVNGKPTQGMPGLPGDTMMTLQGNLNFPPEFCLDLNTLSDRYTLIKPVQVNSPGTTATPGNKTSDS